VGADVRGVSDIGALSFGPTIELLTNASRGANMEAKQIANNIANVETPNFRRGTTSFREALVASMGAPASPDQLALATDDDRQFNVDGAQAPTPFNPQPHIDDTTQMRVDRSNVDIDQETSQLQDNAGYQQTVSQLLRKQYTFLREAIQEQTQ
jgi:flagellar basal-body rod protein FlgB